MHARERDLSCLKPVSLPSGLPSLRTSISVSYGVRVVHEGQPNENTLLHRHAFAVPMVRRPSATRPRRVSHRSRRSPPRISHICHSGSPTLCRVAARRAPRRPRRSRRRSARRLVHPTITLPDQTPAPCACTLHARHPPHESIALLPCARRGVTLLADRAAVGVGRVSRLQREQPDVSSVGCRFRRTPSAQRARARHVALLHHILN